MIDGRYPYDHDRDFGEDERVHVTVTNSGRPEGTVTAQRLAALENATKLATLAFDELDARTLHSSDVCMMVLAARDALARLDT